MTLRRPFALVLALAIVTVTTWLALGTRSVASAVPTIIADCSPAPLDCSGWYRSDVSLDWTVLPSTAVPTGCVDKTLTSDTTGSYEVCSATDGVRVTVELWIAIDKTPPVIAAGSLARPPDANGWYRSPVGATFEGVDATSGVRHCTVPIYGGPDSAAASVAGTCTDIAGNTSAPFELPLRYDATGPDVTSGKPARKPDHGRWYTRPVFWRFGGKDSLSGLAECPSVRYAGPDGAAARVVGACRDKAGNVSTRSFVLRYDATPPARPVVKALPRDRAVRLRIGVGSDARTITIVRAPGRGGTRDSTIYRGAPRSFTDFHVRNGTRYRYTVIARDRAAHRSRGTDSATPGPRLLAPADGAVLTVPPRLRWTPVRHADYYNVQLRRDGRKVLSRWPSQARLQLLSRWRFRGSVRHLVPGRYDWDVWPGFGNRKAARCGARIGGRSFVIPEAPAG